MKMEMQHKVYVNVRIGKNSKIGDLVIIGTSPTDVEEDVLETVIGDNAVIRSHSCIYAGNKIGDNFKTGNGINIRENNIIGNNVSIGTRTVIEHNVRIEDNVRIHSSAFIPEHTILRKDCWIGPCVVITNAKYPKSEYTKNNLIGVEVGEKARIGANATLLPGVKVGKNSLIGAGSVVTKDVPENVVVAGNPAKITKKIEELSYKEGRAYE